MGSKVQVFLGPLQLTKSAGSADNLIDERSAKHERAHRGEAASSRSAKMIVLLQEVKETNTSVFDGIRHALTLHDAYETAIE